MIKSNEPLHLECGVNPVCSSLFVSLSAAHTFSLPFSATQAFCFVLFDSEYWMSNRNDAIWLTSCSLSMVSMATVSSEWGHGSNWPIVSKLHFSEWFPQSSYWNRAPVLWWIHLVIHSLEGKRGKYKHDTGGLALLKQRGYQMKKHTNTPTAEMRPLPVKAPKLTVLAYVNVEF